MFSYAVAPPNAIWKRANFDAL